MPAMKPELSKKNQSYISKNRFYELKYYARQYPEWESAVAALNTYNKPGSRHVTGFRSSPIERLAMLRELYLQNMRNVEQAAMSTGDIYPWIFQAVTQGLNYASLDPPCSLNTFYKYYRQFYAVLDEIRG